MPITQKTFELNNMIIEATFLDEDTTGQVDEPEGQVEIIEMFVVVKETNWEIPLHEIDYNEVLNYYDALKRTTLSEYDLGCIDDEGHPFYS